MTTLDDDMIRIQLGDEQKMYRCHDIGVPWPPPERLTQITVDGKPMELPVPLIRKAMSELTDEQSAGSDNVSRAAWYVPE